LKDIKEKSLSLIFTICHFSSRESLNDGCALLCHNRGIHKLKKMSKEEISISIDARGSYCPGPMMELIKAIRQAEVGEVVELLSSEEGSLSDIPAWIEKAKHELVAIIKEDGYNRFLVRKKR